MRKLHLDHEVVEYSVHKSGTVMFRFESGQKMVTSIAKIKGIEESVFERGRFKRTSDAQVTPSELKEFIMNG